MEPTSIRCPMANMTIGPHWCQWLNQYGRKATMTIRLHWCEWLNDMVGIYRSIQVSNSRHSNMSPDIGGVLGGTTLFYAYCLKQVDPHTVRLADQYVLFVLYWEIQWTLVSVVCDIVCMLQRFSCLINFLCTSCSFTLIYNSKIILHEISYEQVMMFSAIRLLRWGNFVAIPFSLYHILILLPCNYLNTSNKNCRGKSLSLCAYTRNR